MRKIVLTFLSLLAIQQILQAQQITYSNHHEVGIVTYGPIPTEIGFAARTFHGVEFNNAYTVGLNVGINRFPVEGENRFWTLPITVKNRYVFHHERKAALFADLDLGYALASLNKEKKDTPIWFTYKGGAVVNPQVGLKFKDSTRKFYWTLAGGYLYQRLTTTSHRNYDPRLSDTAIGWIGDFNQATNIYDLHRLTFMVGFGF